MYTTIALTRALRARGVAADFRATGQTGILIAGDGVAVDAVVADFISGAIEQLAPARSDDGWDLIEGQGSLFHPSFAGVSLGLLHGAQPKALVLCHEPGRAHMRGIPGRALPDLAECLERQSRRGAADQPRRARGRHLPQHLGHGAGGRAPAVRRRPRTGSAFPAPIRSPSASIPSSTTAMSRTLQRAARSLRADPSVPDRPRDEDRGGRGDGDDRRGRRRSGAARPFPIRATARRSRARSPRSSRSAPLIEQGAGRDRAARRPARRARRATRSIAPCGIWRRGSRGRDVAAMIGGPALRPLASAMTVVIDTPEAMARGGRCWRTRRC